MIRTVLAIIAGVIVTALLGQLGAIGFLLVTIGIPLGAAVTDPSAGGYAVLLTVGALAAAVGARVARRIAGDHARVAVLGLSGVLAVLALWAFRQPGSQWPAWWAAALAMSVAAGAGVGGLLGRVQQLPDSHQSGDGDGWVSPRAESVTNSSGNPTIVRSGPPAWTVGNRD
jgi:hypothetical protein